MKNTIFFIFFIFGCAYANFIKFNPVSVNNGNGRFHQGSLKPRRVEQPKLQEKEILNVHAISIRNGPKPMKYWNSRIYGGSVAIPHSIPFQAAIVNILINGSYYFCGGTLIRREWILTAAHCLDGASEATVVLGAHNLTADELTQVIIPGLGYRIHEGWNRDTVVDDIAVLRLRYPVRLNRFIRLAILPNRIQANNADVGDHAVVSGWGITGDNKSDISDVLRYANVNVITNSQCLETFENVPDTEICTVGAINGSSCEGDSGGPLIDKMVQIGIVSYGTDSCEQNYPSVYTRVISYLDWIQTNVN